nr:hypothetical protein [Pseudonocardia sp. AL041005-10]
MTDTPFHDLDAYVALPRLGGLALSPDGTRLVTGVAELDADGTRYRTALWEVDPAGEAPARRLTRGAAGESGPVFTPRATSCSGRPARIPTPPGRPSRRPRCGGCPRPAVRPGPPGRGPAGSPRSPSPRTRGRSSCPPPRCPAR